MRKESEVLGKSIKELKFSVKEVVEGVSIGELERVGTGIVRVWTEGSSEWFGRIHWEKKVGELVGWIKRHLLLSPKKTKFRLFGYRLFY